ncbi:ankyrin repeat domain-containing protein [Wolbachia endosymbiont (group A) of Anoplius nigerrimus]|uniref:ankyrin repeat domain-containing protein n=1 Tax=Wolbachia endosymbiont (group A) of Anoplius nigerrimus TaxID=2953979 RepID=UPI00222F29DE|nr:ankyrin repeat domain-containing protein [Wolbachia endosymbiont (group A) of Anoplius nigerrimus]
MLSAVDKEEGLSKDNVIERIKERLEAEGKGEYEKWGKADFNVNHLFETDDTLPSWFSCDKLTLLHSAARNNLGNVADVLSKVEGIDVNAAAKNPEYTPLHIAALHNSEKAAGALLKAKEIDVNAATFFLPPLHLAISFYSHKIVEVLCKERPDIINAKNKDGYTPLHEAISSSNEQAICILLKNGADVNVVDECRNTPLHEAACKSNTDILNILIRNGASIDEVNKFGNTPLHQAVNHKCEKVVNILIENGANVNAIGRGGYAPLYLAVENNHVGIVNSLLKREDIKVNIMDGDTPLYKAASKGYIKVVDTLLKAKGINVK